MAMDEQIHRTRAKEVEIDVLLDRGQHLAAELQETMIRIAETVRTHQEPEPETSDDH